MAQATLRFYAELNDYLPPALRGRDNSVAFDPPCPVRHLVETFGVPHTEIELILLDGESIGMETGVDDGDRISIYPEFEAFDVSPLVRLRAHPLRAPRFFADAQLGRLARYLRLLGFDTLYENHIDDGVLVRQAVDEHRIILTRDRNLLMRRAVTHGCHIRADEPSAQLAQVVRRCDLAAAARPFTRCMICNGSLRQVDKAAIADRLEPATRAHYEEFWQCTGCNRLFWKGSHYAGLQRLVEGTIDRDRKDGRGD